jgi:hypothetical protein
MLATSPQRLIMQALNAAAAISIFKNQKRGFEYTADAWTANPHLGALPLC